MLSAKELRAFEDDIIAEFNAAKIAAPVHLANGNEDELIEIFKVIREHDWILCTWRSHYHCLLKGVPLDQVKHAIMVGRSIALCFPEYRVLSSAIVGGICPIAVGLAWGIKQRKLRQHVHVFIGDMAAESGIYHESMKYAAGHNLPIIWRIEDNGKSVCTDTRKVWGPHRPADIRRYTYKLNKPHVGTGKFVRF